MSVRENRKSRRVSRQGRDVGKSERDGMRISKEQMLFKIDVMSTRKERPPRVMCMRENFPSEPEGGHACEHMHANK